MLFAGGGGTITKTALTGADDLGYDLTGIRAIIAALTRSEFVKSATAHNPVNHRNWHDTYHHDVAGGLTLFIKLAGETVAEIALTSFKER